MTKRFQLHPVSSPRAHEFLRWKKNCEKLGEFCRKCRVSQFRYFLVQFFFSVRTWGRHQVDIDIFGQHHNSNPNQSLHSKFPTSNQPNLKKICHFHILTPRCWDQKPAEYLAPASVAPDLPPQGRKCWLTPQGCHEVVLRWPLSQKLLDKRKELTKPWLMIRWVIIRAHHVSSWLGRCRSYYKYHLMDLQGWSVIHLFFRCDGQILRTRRGLGASMPCKKIEKALLCHWNNHQEQWILFSLNHGYQTWSVLYYVIMTFRHLTPLQPFT